MKKLIIAMMLSLGLIAGCTTANDVAIQQAHATSRASECAAVAQIAQAGAASEAAVLMAARGCGASQAPATSADRLTALAGALAPIAGAAINGAVALKQGETAAGTQRAQIAAGVARAGIEASVLQTLGQDQVVTVRPEIVTPEIVQAPNPVIVETPAPIVTDPVIIETPAPIIVEKDAPQICAPNADGDLICQ